MDVIEGFSPGVCAHHNVVPDPNSPGDGWCLDCLKTGFPISEEAAGGCPVCGSYGPCEDDGCQGRVETAVIRVALPPTLLDVLDRLVSTRLYGDDRAGVVATLLGERLREVGLSLPSSGRRR